MKIHIVSGLEPFIIAESVVADCGKLVEKPQIAMMFDTQAMGAMVDFPPGVCPKFKTASDSKNSRYVYAIQGDK